MFVGRRGNKALRLFYASELKGDWTEHAMSPFVEKDGYISRPGGRPIVIDGILYRFGQDIGPANKNLLRAFQVLEINKTNYKEKMIDTPIIQPASSGWNSDQMHHADIHQIDDKLWIASVDGQGIPLK